MYTTYTGTMTTTQLNPSSAAFADHVHEQLRDVRETLQSQTETLRYLESSLDADGKDFERGPHAPPITEIRTLLNVATTLIIHQESYWRTAADARHRERALR